MNSRTDQNLHISQRTKNANADPQKINIYKATETQKTTINKKHLKNL